MQEEHTLGNLFGKPDACWPANHLRGFMKQVK